LLFANSKHSHGETLKTLVGKNPLQSWRDFKNPGGVNMTLIRFPISSKNWWCGWDLTPAWFLISSQKIGGEPGKTHKEELHKLLFFCIIIEK
jgi:hypothetical protein